MVNLNTYSDLLMAAGATQGTSIGSMEASSEFILNNGFSIDINATYVIEDFSISGAELKTCLKVLLKIAKEKSPEEFI